MSFALWLCVGLLLLVVGVLPTWRYSASWGYTPSGILSVALVVVLLLFLMGRL